MNEPLEKETAETGLLIAELPRSDKTDVGANSLNSQLEHNGDLAIIHDRFSSASLGNRS